MEFIFADHLLDIDRRELRRSGERIALEPQVFDLLVYLVRNRERVVSKDDLLEAIWGGRIVSESTMTSRINAARRAVGDSGEAQRLIRTVPRKGIRFVGVVQEGRGPPVPIDASVVVAEARLRAALPLPDKPSIAVLPFVNMSSDPEQEYFADGIAEDIITLLSKARSLFVIARNSAFTYKGKAGDAKNIARELGVRYLLEGSVRRAGDRVRVTAQLIEAATGGHLWAERYDRDLVHIFALQDEITGAVSGAILPAMERTERERAARKPPDSLDAWECYHRGLWHFAKLEDRENDRARRFFQRAIELDSGFAAGYSGIALTYLVEATVFRRPDLRPEFMPPAAEHARRSIAADPTNAVGHCSLSYVLLLSGRHRESMAEADLAVGLDANFAWGHAGQGSARTFGGRPAEAIEPLNTAIRLSPFDPQMSRWLHHLARAHYFMRDYETALAIARQGCQSYPNYRPTYRALIASLGQIGQVAEAQRAMADAAARHGESVRFSMLNRQPELRGEDHVHMLEGWRKGGVIP